MGAEFDGGLGLWGGGPWAAVGPAGGRALQRGWLCGQVMFEVLTPSVSLLSCL